MIALPFQDRQSRDHLEQAGINAERQLAHYLARKFGDDPRVDLFFGLRIPLDHATGSRRDAVQMDALLIHCHGMAIIESKSVHDEVRVNKRGEWSRTWAGKVLGMSSPVEQAKRQSDALRKLLQANRTKLRGKVIFGLLQGGFGACPIECFVAISDSGRITRDPPDSFREVMKAEQIADCVRIRVDRHQKFGGIVGLLRASVANEETDDGNWSMTEEERGRVKEFLVNSKG
ncbi:MAG: nuclease-related domain-containing protein [Phycisphaerales bacterium]